MFAFSNREAFIVAVNLLAIATLVVWTVYDLIVCVTYTYEPRAEAGERSPVQERATLKPGRPGHEPDRS
jgi:hypothetical protein